MHCKDVKHYMYTRSPPTAGIFLEICQFSQNLLANGNQFVQPGAQISKVGRVDLAVFVSAFGDLIQIVTAILKQIIRNILGRDRELCMQTHFLIEPSPQQ